MKLLPYSNSFHKTKIKRDIKPFDIIKYILLVIGSILIIGFLYEFISCKIEDGRIIDKNKFVRVDGNKYHYKVMGKGDITVIFDGDMGVPFNQWKKVADILEKEGNCRMFFYNRTGYGLNDLDKNKSPEQQARDLRMVLKKLGINSQVILVGEGYGTLVMTNFAKIFPKYVEGMVLINPINENQFKDSDFIKEYKNKAFGQGILKAGSYVGLTKLLYNMNLIKDPTGYLNNINEDDKKEFKILRTRNNYISAYKNELFNVINGNSKSQQEGLIGDKYLTIINNSKFSSKQKDLENLTTNKDDLDIVDIDSSSDIVSLEKSEDISTAIRQMCKKYINSKKAT
ncbi:alpha/beta fold hydrolase [Clostridium fallax]|uniref:Ndr family protein n=1 Tax=Clostridium fallax TaxID=1533 RepID=A0A1M4WFV3_9CLOT|nr:alpha/beta hydrolase [Clostridium fallax]SHE80057.1 Ndr family protein [Clostridium fallax]SQB04947.1 alpha/beta fold family hydrolase [Clostridium fallax]